jgi:hypothetical protein
MTAPRPRTRQTKQLNAGMFQAEISSFALRLAAEGKAAKMIRTYTEAVQWFAAATLPGQAGRAAGRGAARAGHRLVPAAPGRRGKAARTVQGYTSAVRWFAAGYLLG